MNATTSALPVKVLVLYSELAPYVLACLERLIADHGVEVHLVRWPVNKEAPFELRFGPGIHLYERSELDDENLLSHALAIDPHVVFASGWMDKGYLRVCRVMHGMGKPTVMCSDTAWRGDMRQWIASMGARFVFPGTFSHAWVTGADQHTYAEKLGFAPEHIRTGFYSADIDRFLPVGERLLKERKAHWPHRFLCVARYIPTKQQQLLCDAFAELCNEGTARDWELHLAGTGEDFEQVTGSESGRHPRIKHHGFVQPDAMPELLQQCGVFVLPSSHEPWGVVVHEQACSAFPLLLSDAIGARERFLEPGANGAVFASENLDELREALRSFIIREDADLHRMGVRSLELGAQWGPEQWAATAMSFIAAPHAEA
ncbi:MAG TPA: glycosyltransferase family 4 protein [Flavobacteriales bacterium]